MKYLQILFLLILSINLFAQEEAGQDYDLKWKKFKSKEFHLKCKLPLEHDVVVHEHEFGKEMQVSSEHEFLSFFVSVLIHKNDMSATDPEEWAMAAVYNFMHSMDGELVYMRVDEHSGGIGYESRIKLKDEMQARYAVYMKGQIQYQVAEIFLSDPSEAYFHDLMKSLKLK